MSAFHPPVCGKGVSATPAPAHCSGPAENVAPPLDGLRRVRRLFGELGELGRDRGSFRPFRERARSVSQNLGETRGLAAPPTPFAEESEHSRVRRLELAQPLEIRLRGVRPLAHLPVHHGDLEDSPCLALSTEGRELALVKRD